MLAELLSRGGGRSIRLVAVFAVFAVSVVVAADARATEATVEARGLRVAGEAYGGEDGLRPFNWFSGVSIALLVTCPDGGIIEFDSQDSELKELKDDKGTDLAVRGKYSFPGFTSSGQVSEDGKALMLEVNGGGIPARGANAIKAAGTLVVRTATEKKTYKVENVPLKLDQKVQAGEIAFTVRSIGKPDWGDKELRIGLEASQDTSTIASVRFLDADGAEIESSQSGRMTMTMGDSVKVTTDYDLAKKVDAVTVEVTYWTDMQERSIPFEVTVSAGL